MDYSGKKCPVCSQCFDSDDDIVVCPKCGAPYHRSCYEKAGKCIFTELHQKGEAWKSDDEDTTRENPQKNTKRCRFCGHLNDENAVACEQCGRGFNEYPYPNYGGFGGNDENGRQDADAFPGFGGMPFKIDLMAGVKPDEDFDGVTGEEISKYVKSNTIYYMEVFKRLKDKGKSRFNFAAFIFGGGWMLYRKQYFYGIIFTILMAAFTIGSSFVSVFFSSPILNDIAEQLNQAYPNGYTINIFYNELSKLPPDQFFIAMIPTILSSLYFVLMSIAGFCGNRLYYKYSIKQIKKIKALHVVSDTESAETTVSKKKLHDAIGERGGTNTAIAICLLVCDMLISFVPQFFIR